MINDFIDTTKTKNPKVDTFLSREDVVLHPANRKSFEDTFQNIRGKYNPIVESRKEDLHQPISSELEKTLAEIVPDVSPIKASKWFNLKPLIQKTVTFAGVSLLLVGMFGIYLNSNDQIKNIDQTTQTQNDSSGSVLGSSSDQAPSEEPITTQSISIYKTDPEKPRYIRIPAIKLDTTRVKQLGLGSDGAINNPSNIYDVGWFNQSSLPTAQAGNIFIAGHYSGLRSNGVFRNLKNLNLGDTIEVESGDGLITKFVVKNKIEIKYDQIKMEQFLTSIDQSKLGLTLMTCAGNYNPSSVTFDARTVIQAVKI